MQINVKKDCELPIGLHPMIRIPKKMNQLKKRKTELLAIAGLASTDKIATTNGMIMATPKVSNVNNSIRSVTKGAVGANNNSNSNAGK